MIGRARGHEILVSSPQLQAQLNGASHFPGLTFGRVLSGEGRRYWQAL